MDEHVAEAFDNLFKALHRQGRRVEELEARVVELERRLSPNPESEVFGERHVVRISEPDQSNLCQACDHFHSAELPCVPVDEAWRIFGGDFENVSAKTFDRFD